MQVIRTMLHVEPVAPEHRRAALEVLLQDLAPPIREPQIADMLDAAARGDASLDGLLFARDDEQPLGAVLFLLQPDGCGFVWPPVMSHGVAAELVESAADALLQAVCRRLDETQAWLGQCLLELHNERDALRMQRNGFEFLTDLTYLRRPLNRALPAIGGGSNLYVECVDPELDRERLASVIERTYAGSADCPQLNGLRTGREAVAGHRLTGIPLRDGWMVFRDSSGDVGVLLLADQPQQDAWELVYMGVVPEARGRGYGRKIVEIAVHSAARSSRRDLLLAVDERNRFARTIYESAGFEFFDRQRVHVRRPVWRTQK